jgi:hypothetical protein
MFGQLLHDGQTEPEAAVFPRRRTIGLPETIK